MSIMKKFALILAICAVFSLSNFKVAFAYPDPVAVISNYSNLKGRIQIHRANGEPNGSQSLLYPGDKITGDVGYIKLECGPYADYQNVNNQYYLISYNPPTGAEKLADELYALTTMFFQKVNGILDKNGERRIDASTKGAELGNQASYGFDLNPRPGFNTTLMNNQKVIFAGVSKADNFGQLTAPKSYVVKNSSGQMIYSGTFNKNGEAEIDLSSQNLNASEKYTWVVDGKAEYDFTILDAGTTKNIQDIFSKVDAKKLSAEKRNLEKAFLAQYLSDNSDGKINLYWLSAQLLMEISPKSDDDKAEKYRLLQKCHNHLMEELDEYIK